MSKPTNIQLKTSLEAIAPAVEVEEPITLHFESGEIVQIPWRSDACFGDLWPVIQSQQPEAEREEFNFERCVFYDVDYRRIEFGWDAQTLPTRFIRIMIIDEDLIDYVFDGPEDAIAVWPWLVTHEEARAWSMVHFAARDEERRLWLEDQQMK